ncbi:winged helix-turn-helix transcriptional regulator [Phenylobacterium terrae]
MRDESTEEPSCAMKWDELPKEACSVARTVAVIGDRWTLMILRDCFLGVRRFEAFQERLGISRTIIADRLKLLTDEGVLRREAYQERPVRYEYRLTPKGLELHPVLMAIVGWGDRHYAGEAGPPVLNRHKACGCDFHAVMTCSECGEAVGPRDVQSRPGPGARN